MTDLTIREVTDPVGDTHTVEAYVRLNNVICSLDTGHDDLSTWTAAEAVAMLQDTDHPTRLLVAEDGEGVVGAVTVSREATDAEAMEFDLMVQPARRWASIEVALLEAAAAVMRDDGLDTLQTWSLHRPDPPAEPLSPSTGVGVIPGEDPYPRFLLAAGFTLEQVERNSRFDLQGDLRPVEAMLEEAIAAAGPDYTLVSWSDAVPDEHAEGFAWVLSRMSTDPPAGGMTTVEEVWDVARVRRREARLRAQELFISVVAVLHVPTGAIAAYNELVIGPDRTEPTQQYGTLVVREHRGHRLGLLVKCAGLLRWHDLVPESPRVTTFNAEENDHMLAINVAIGFVPASYAGAWKRVSAASGSAGRSGSSGS